MRGLPYIGVYKTFNSHELQVSCCSEDRYCHFLSANCSYRFLGILLVVPEWGEKYAFKWPFNRAKFPKWFSF